MTINERQTYIKAEELQHFTKEILVKNGVPENDADIVADSLVAANLRGVDTHGVLRLKIYVDRIKAGGNNPTPSIKVVKDSPVSAVLDGDNSLGQVGGYRTMKLAIEKAHNTGVGIVTIRNSNHYGTAGYYAMMALEEDMIGVSFTNVLASMPPTGGRQPRVGNNPFAIVFPAGEEYPVVLDAASSLSSWGKLFIAAQKGEPLPEGCFLDKDGNPTLKPEDVFNGGMLLPIADYKGYGLALCIGIFTGLLSGGSFDVDVPHPNIHIAKPGDNSFFMAAIKIDQFVPVEQFKQRMDEIIKLIKTTELASDADRIYLPGEKEYEMEKQRRITGIPLSGKMIDELNLLAQEAGMSNSLFG